MTKTARVYGGSLYDLAAEEKLDGQIMEQMIAVRQIFRENPGYLKLLGEPAIPEEERLKMIEEAFGGQAERYLVNFLKLLCERKILREFAGCCEEFIRRYNSAHGIAEAVVTSAVKLSETQMEALKAKLEKISGKQVYLVQKTDTSVIAGLRVELEGVQLDGTVQSRISGISKKTIQHMEQLCDSFDKNEIFGRSRVEEVTGLKNTRASLFLKELLERNIIQKVTGHGKGKYTFFIKE